MPNRETRGFEFGSGKSLFISQTRLPKRVTTAIRAPHSFHKSRSNSVFIFAANWEDKRSSGIRILVCVVVHSLDTRTC